MMSIDGTYGFVYCGASGLGIGIFTVIDERFEGSDYGGGRYSGTAKENSDGTISVAITFDVPAGMVLVQGTAPQDVAHTRSLKVDVPSNFGDGKPQELSSPPGRITVMIKRIPDEYAPAATAGVSLQIAQRIAADRTL